MIKIRIFDDKDQAGIYAAALCEQVVLTRDKPVLGLATGSTAIPFYRALVRLHTCGLSLQHVTTFNLDEYVGLAPDHPQSYHHFMAEHLFSKVDISATHAHIPHGEAMSLPDECQRYDHLLSVHPIDFQLLGIGVNGHIGFNEPGDLLVSQTHVVQLSEETIESNARFFQEKAEVPKRAITMGVQAILQAKQIVLMAFGEEKAEIVAKAAKGEIRTDVPASVLQLHHDVTLVLDRDSSSRLLLT